VYKKILRNISNFPITAAIPIFVAAQRWPGQEQRASKAVVDRINEHGEPLTKTHVISATLPC
jgi:hypothetical protein